MRLHLHRKAAECAEWSFALCLLQRIGYGGNTLQTMHLVTGELDHRHTRERGGEAAVMQSKDVHGVATSRLLLPIFPSGKDQAGGHALEVPLERRRAGFIEVVDVKDEPTIRSGVGAEVAHMGVAADLRDDSGVGHCGEVRGHDRHGAAKEAEGRSEHTFVLQRDQRWDASAHGVGDGGERRGPMGGRTPARVLLATQLLATRLAQGAPVRGRNASCHT